MCDKSLEKKEGKILVLRLIVSIHYQTHSFYMNLEDSHSTLVSFGQLDLGCGKDGHTLLVGVAKNVDHSLDRKKGSQQMRTVLMSQQTLSAV